MMNRFVLTQRTKKNFVPLCALCVKIFIAAFFGVLCSASASALPLTWRADWPDAKPVETLVHRGTDIELQPTWYINKAPANTTNWTFTTFCQTNAVGPWFGPLPGAFFSHTNDVGAAFYNVMVRAQTPGGAVNYTAFARLRMLDSPGFAPGELPLPVSTIDFSKVVAVNAPWLLPAATNGFIKVEIDPTVPGATNALNASLSSRLSLASAAATNYTDSVSAALSAADAVVARDATNYTDSVAGELVTSIAGKYPASSGEQLAQQVAAIGAHINGEAAKVMVTNYNSFTHLPEAEFDINVSNNWLVVWREMTRWNWFLGDVFDPHTNAVARALADKAEKEYAFFDGVTGEPAPDGFFWISQPRVAICAGAAYQRYVDTAGEVWVLESNGMVADINGTTNGYFRISDDQNNVQFEIVKGDSRTVVAAPGAMTRSSVMGVTHWHTTYMVTNAVSAPKAMFCRDLANPEWYAEDDVGCPCNVEWSHPSEGIYVCEWWTQGNEPAIFMRSQYGQGSESRIIQNAPVEMQYIVIGGTKYALGTATIDGKTVLTLSTP